MINYTKYRKLAIILLLPQLFITLIFFVGPAISALVQSFLFSDAFGLYNKFAGWNNFIDLFHDTSYKHAIWVTIIIAFFITLLTMSLGMLLAVLVQSRSKSQQLYKTLLIWPYAIAPAVAAILWRFLFQPGLGWLTYILQECGITFNYLINVKQALLVIIIAASWQQLSYNFLFFLTGLKLIPHSLIEAAIIEGASSWQCFWQIIFPLLSPTIFYLLLINLTYAFFDTFGIIDIITYGGPNNTTTTLAYKIYKDGFMGLDLGSASAQSVLLMTMVILMTLLQFRFLENRVHYK